MSAEKSSDSFRVIIAGGGIAGLTLANALQLGGIDFVLLERRNTIAPQVGASIGILPNGARIVDQIGCFDEILEEVEPLHHTANHRKDGSYIEISDGPQLMVRRSGYHTAFLDRQIVLEILSSHVDPKKILLEKDVKTIMQQPDKVIVKCKDGTEFTGDVLAGADGVNSKTRKEMWRLAKAEDPNAIPTADVEIMNAEYKCLFGISSRTKTMPLGYVDCTFTKHTSTFCITGKDHKVYFFIFQKLPKVVKGDEIPKYTREDAEAFAEEVADYNIMPKGEIKFRDIWDNRMSYTLVALEEAEYKKWTWGRIACLGDSIHKMTPNAGHGGNAAIESAAAFANAIKDMLDKARGGHPTYEQVTTCLAAYQKSREKRTSEIMKVANKLTRIQAEKTFGDWFFGHILSPAMGDALIQLHSGSMIGATMINYLPPPPRSVTPTMPFNPEQGVDKKESKLARAFFALPFLVLSAIAMQCMDATVITDQLISVLTTGQINWATGSAAVVEKFYGLIGLNFLDEIWRVVVVVFSQWNIGFDVAGSWQMFTFLTDFGLLYSIYLIEANRRANVLSLAQLPVVFGLAAQIRGIGLVAPIYYFFHYVFCAPIENFAASDQRLTNLAYIKGILPAVALAYYVPHFMADFAASPELRMKWNFVWQMFPVWVMLIQRVLKWTGIVPDTIKRDRIDNPWRDLPWLRVTILLPAILSAVVWIYTLRNAPVSLAEIFVPVWPVPTEMVANLRNFVQFDHLFCFGSTFLWLALLIHDLKVAGMTKTSWFSIVLTAVGVTAVAGPAVAVGLGFLWREQILATKRHKGAITETTVIDRTAKPFINGNADKEMNGVTKH